MIRNIRKIFKGRVISNKSEKTINVLVKTYKKCPIYKKRVKYSKKYLVHDEQNKANAGDKVKIMETRPLSKKKHFRLFEIIEKKTN